MPELDPHWWWLVAAVVLATMEIIAPGIFLIWLAAAAGLTGLITWLIGDTASTGLQLLVFSIFAFGSIYFGRTLLLRKALASADPLLNNRAARLVGEIGTVVEPIASGSGRVQIGDSPWPASGPDTAAGQRVRIVGVEGTRLIVEPL